MYSYDYSAYFLWERLQQLENELTSLKKENQELKEKIASIKPIQIDKIEYKIHELQVQTLSGTLNVGLTANGDETCMGEVIEKIVEEHRSNFVMEESSENNQKSSPPTEET